MKSMDLLVVKQYNVLETIQTAKCTSTHHAITL